MNLAALQVAPAGTSAVEGSPAVEGSLAVEDSPAAVGSPAAEGSPAAGNPAEDSLRNHTIDQQHKSSSVSEAEVIRRHAHLAVDSCSLRV